MGQFGRSGLVRLVLTQLFLVVGLCSLLAQALDDGTVTAPTSTTPTSAASVPTSNVAANANGAAAAVKLGVFMESLCPDTRRFFRNQLVPAQRLIGVIMELEIVPFGHARVVGNNKMICQHGARECEGNRRMACILARSRNQTEIVETFGCLLTVGSSPKDCVEKNAAGLSFDELEKCTAGDESYQLMVAAEKATGRIHYVPHLTVDGNSSDEIQDQAENHLKDYMCKLYTGSARPEACKSEPQ